jgi:hypothetical protein
MSHNEFNDILSRVNGLSPTQLRRLARELETRLAVPVGQRPAHRKAARQESEQTAFDVASRAGLIGCIKGSPRSPTDLSTNPKHMKGFGGE